MKIRNVMLPLAGLLIGGVVGISASTTFGQASIIDSFLNFVKDLSTPTVSTSTVAPQPVPLYKPALDYEEAVIAAVEKGGPAVVSIVITQDLPIIESCPFNPFGGEFNDPFFEFRRPCETGTETREVGGGSGFIISRDGMIVTNKHVVLAKDASYTVLTNNGERFDAEVLARDPVQDIAIIKIDATSLTPATLGDSNSIKPGQTAIAIGNALGEFRNTVSVGVISGLSRDITAFGGRGFSERLEGLLQTDAAINQGNSGGPLLNLKGEVVGVNTAVASGAQNIGFAIPINQVKRDIASVKETGSIKFPFVGVHYRITEGGALVGNEEGPAIFADSPAEKAGLRDGDIITKLNGEKVSAENSLGKLINKYNIGDTVTLTIKRGDQTLTLQITLAERPDL